MLASDEKAFAGFPSAKLSSLVMEFVKSVMDLEGFPAPGEAKEALSDLPKALGRYEIPSLEDRPPAPRLDHCISGHLNTPLGLEY